MTESRRSVTGACKDCHFDWTASTRDLIDAIETCPDRLARALHPVDEQLLRQRPAPETWSALEYTVHTADVIVWYAARIERVVTEDHPRLTPFDWDAACAERAYNGWRVADALAQLDQACTRFASRLRSFAPEQWERQGVGSEGSPRSIDALVRRAAHEVTHHVFDIKAVLSEVSRQLTVNHPDG